MDIDVGITRRAMLRLLAAGAAATPLAACGDAKPWHDVDVGGSSPALRFSLQRAPDGRPVFGADYRGEIVMLYFGYTFCPDACPLTLQNANETFSRMGGDAQAVRFLFVTVDPARDSLDVLGRYCAQFGPRVTGLRGTQDQLARLARRYRIAYSVTPAAGGVEAVTHSSAIYVFDRSGAARLLVPSFASSTPDIAGVADDLTRLARQRPSEPAWLERLV